MLEELLSSPNCFSAGASPQHKTFSPPKSAPHPSFKLPVKSFKDGLGRTRGRPSCAAEQKAKNPARDLETMEEDGHWTSSQTVRREASVELDRGTCDPIPHSLLRSSVILLLSSNTLDSYGRGCSLLLSCEKPSE